MENYKKYLEINPEIRFGKFVIKRTRISVGNFLGWLSTWMNIVEIIEDFPQLTKEQILACFSYAQAQTNNTQIV